MHAHYSPATGFLWVAGMKIFIRQAKRDALLRAKIKSLVKDFKKLFPAIPFVAEFSWAGTFGSTKDGLPFIRTYKKLPNIFFCTGFWWQWHYL